MPDAPAAQVPAPLSIKQQADLLDGILTKTVMHNGTVASFTAVNVTADEVNQLTQLVNRLYILARFEEKIRELVKWGRV
ncbi:hypothetical protein [Pleomorphomonas oryzae]|uniref:hypothetical protein n=1 Tax=Pleomorphomonas oryzae TaxID=261934 RepID=UPI00047C4CF9|nr:hypothetical protein [Pleomorphomonas oryzae]